MSVTAKDRKIVLMPRADEYAFEYYNKPKLADYGEKLERLNTLTTSLTEEIFHLGYAAADEIEKLEVITNFWREEFLKEYSKNEIFEQEIGKLLAGKKLDNETDDNYWNRCFELFSNHYRSISGRIDKYKRKVKKENFVNDWERSNLGMWLTP